MASSIKTEVDVSTTKSLYCHGCLSQDRKLKPLSGEIYKLYYSLLGSGILYGSEEHIVCWECEAMLRRVRKFQNQILQTQTALLELFYNMSPKLETLSNLSVTTKDYYNDHYEYIEQTYTQTDSILRPNINWEIVPDPKPTSELSLLKNCQVKIDDLKLEPENSEHSDYEIDFDDGINNFEISNEPIIRDNVIVEFKEKKKESVTKTNKVTKAKRKIDEYKKKEKVSVNKTNKVRKTRKRLQFKLSRVCNEEYLKYATVKDINPEFEPNARADNPYSSYFIKEFLNLEQIEECYRKLKDNPCGERCMDCRLDVRVDFLSIIRKNLGNIKPDSTTHCLLCKKKLRKFDKLIEHWKNSHCEFYKCTICNLYCKKGVRVIHLNEQHTKVYSCKKCDREFTSKYHFKLHFKRLHDTFACHHCNKVSKNRFLMIKHLIKRHGDGPTTYRDSRERYQCAICNKHYTVRHNRLQHIRTHHPETLNRKVDEEAAYCVECDKQFKSVELFKVHLAGTRIHNPKLRETTYPCPECGKIFKHKASLENHVHQVHKTEQARFVCTICNKICFSNCSLKNHIKSVHQKLPKIKDKPCDICGRGFSSMRVMRNHRRTHTGERPFKCVHCPSAFAQRSACIGHMKKQHNDFNKYTQAYFLK